MITDRTNQTITTKDAYTLSESVERLESLTYKGYAAVSKVIDGDTIEMIMTGSSESVPVRYIGIDSPEKHSSYHGLPLFSTFKVALDS